MRVTSPLLQPRINLESGGYFRSVDYVPSTANPAIGEQRLRTGVTSTSEGSLMRTISERTGIGSITIVENWLGTLT